MTNFSVTLSDLRKAGACFSSYNKVVRHLQNNTLAGVPNNKYLHLSHSAPIPLLQILESNGLDDALWALRCVPDSDRDCRLFAVWCARQVQHLMTDKRSLAALDVAERFANGLATESERAAARDAAWTADRAAWDAARAAARAADGAAWDAAGGAARAADGAAWDAAGGAQKSMFIRMCNGTAPWQVTSRS